MALFVRFLVADTSPGPLSPRAVQVYDGISNTIGLVLSPCCLPNKKMVDIPAQSGTNVSDDQYRFWGHNLAEYISKCRGTSLAAAEVDTNILSERNFMVVAFRVRQLRHCF